MKNVIAIAVLVVLGIIAFMVFKEKPEDNQEKKAEIEAIKAVPLDKLDTLKVERFEGKGEERVKEKYTLKKQKDTWRMVEPVDFQVVESTVDSMTKGLSELRVIDIISEKKEKHASFEVDDDNGVVIKALSGEDVLGHFIVGNAKNGVTFARLPGKNEVYRLKGQLKYNFNKSIRLLREKSIIKVEFDDISKVTFQTGPEETLAFEKSGEDKDAAVKPVDVEIENFDESKAKGVMRTVSRLNAVDFLDEKLPEETTGLGETAAKFTVEAKKEDKPFTATLLIGKEKEGKSQNYAKLADNDQVYLISNYTAKRLMPKAEEYSKPEEEEKKDGDKAGAPVPTKMPSMPMQLPPGVVLPNNP